MKIIIYTILLWGLLESSKSEEVNILVVGLSGSGISSICNSLLGRSSEAQSIPSGECMALRHNDGIQETRKICNDSSHLWSNGKLVTVYDTPGLDFLQNVSPIENVRFNRVIIGVEFGNGRIFNKTLIAFEHHFHRKFDQVVDVVVTFGPKNVTESKVGLENIYKMSSVYFGTEMVVELFGSQYTPDFSSSVMLVENYSQSTRPISAHLLNFVIFFCIGITSCIFVLTCSYIAYIAFLKIRSNELF